MIRMATQLRIMACRYSVQGYYENRYIFAPEIAEYYNMNVRALMSTLRQLARMGILRNYVGGKEPRFIFAKAPAELTLYKILSVLEGDAQFNCCKELMSDPVTMGNHCTLKQELSLIN